MNAKNIERATDIIRHIEHLQSEIKKAQKISDRDTISIYDCFGSNQQFTVKNCKKEIKALTKRFIQSCEAEIALYQQELDEL